jgi:hypothetical protein
MSQKKMLNQATLVILAMCEAEIGKIMVWNQPHTNNSQDPTTKMTTPIWTRGMTQVIEHLLCKGLPALEAKTLNSTPVPQKLIY